MNHKADRSGNVYLFNLIYLILWFSYENKTFQNLFTREFWHIYTLNRQYVYYMVYFGFPINLNNLLLPFFYTQIDYLRISLLSSFLSFLPCISTHPEIRSHDFDFRVLVFMRRQVRDINFNNDWTMSNVLQQRFHPQWPR